MTAAVLALSAWMYLVGAGALYVAVIEPAVPEAHTAAKLAAALLWPLTAAAGIVHLALAAARHGR